MTGIIEPVMTPIIELKPSLSHPIRVVGLSTSSTSPPSASPRAVPGSCFTTAS